MRTGKARVKLRMRSLTRAFPVYMVRFLLDEIAKKTTKSEQIADRQLSISRPLCFACEE